jgi:hypothetical protein
MSGAVVVVAAMAGGCAAQVGEENQQQLVGGAELVFEEPIQGGHFQVWRSGDGSLGMGIGGKIGEFDYLEAGPRITKSLTNTFLSLRPDLKAAPPSLERLEETYQRQLAAFPSIQGEKEPFQAPKTQADFMAFGCKVFPGSGVDWVPDFKNGVKQCFYKAANVFRVQTDFAYDAGEISLGYNDSDMQHLHSVESIFSTSIIVRPHENWFHSWNVGNNRQIHMTSQSPNSNYGAAGVTIHRGNPIVN